MGEEANQACSQMCGRACGIGISAGEAVLNKDVAALEVAEDTGEQHVEGIGGEGAVVIAPPDPFFGRGFADDEFVGGGAGGVFAGVDDEGAFLGDPAFAAEDGFLIESGSGEVPVDALEVVEAVVVDAVDGGGGGGVLLGWGGDVREDVHGGSPYIQSRTRRRSPR